MNKLATALIFSVFATVLVGCSSGGSSAPEPPQNISGQFSGNWENTPGSEEGSAVFNLSQVVNSDAVTGNVIFDSNGRNSCLLNNRVTGTVSGFNVSLTVGNTNFQLTLSNGGNTLSGTYVQTTSTNTCSGETGSGTITVNRG